jgi:hypothetical protein
LFARNLYDKDTEAKHFEPLLAEIERIRSGLASMPLDTSLDFIKNSAMQGWLDQDGPKKVVGTIVFEIFNRLQFFLFSSIFKTINLIDALELMYNAKNYLGWVLIGRSIIEHCAIFNYYTNKFLDTNPCHNDFSISELKAMEDIMNHWYEPQGKPWTLFRGKPRGMDPERFNTAMVLGVIGPLYWREISPGLTKTQMKRPARY